MAAKKKILKSNRQKRSQAEMLNYLSQTLTIKIIAHLRKTSTTAIYAYQKRLVRKGLLTRERELTQKGFEFVKKFLLVSRIVEKSKTNKIRLHNISFTINVIKKPADWDIRRRKVIRIKQRTYKAWNLKGWTQDSFYVDNIEVRTSPRSVIMNFPDIYGATPLSATNKVIKILNGVIPKLEALFRVELSRPEYCNINLSSGHYAITNNEIAKLFLENGWKLRVVDAEGNLRLIIDDSKGLHELEAVDRRHSEEDSQHIKDYLRDLVINKDSLLPSELTKECSGIPSKIDHLAGLQQVGLESQLRFEKNIENYNKNIELHLEVLGQMKDALMDMKNKSTGPGLAMLPKRSRPFRTSLKNSATLRGVC